MTRACVAKAMSAEVCVSDTGFSSVVAGVLRESVVLLLRSKSCCSVLAHKYMRLC